MIHNIEISKNVEWVKGLIRLTTCRRGPWVSMFLLQAKLFHNWKCIWIKLSHFVPCENTVSAVVSNFLDLLQLQTVLFEIQKHWRLLVFNMDWCLLSFEGKNEMAMEAILLMFLSILWLTSITHNSSIDIASSPMDPLTWFNVSWNASYIINIHAFSQIHYPPARSGSAMDPILSQQEFEFFFFSLYFLSQCEGATPYFVECNWKTPTHFMNTWMIMMSIVVQILGW